MAWDMKALRVTNWSRYEPSDSKKCKTMQWVAVPINHDGLGYIEMITRPDGIRMIGGWLLILQVAARCPERGLLIADSGRILGAKEIALKTRTSEKDISACLDTLMEAGWIEEVDVSGSHPDAIRTASGLQDKTDKTIQDKTGEGRFAPPTLADVIEYCKTSGLGIDPEEFFLKNESLGWMSGKTKLKNWKIHAHTWEKKRKQWAAEKTPVIQDAGDPMPSQADWEAQKRIARGEE